MKMYVFEGTPEEISQVVLTMQPIVPAPAAIGKLKSSASAEAMGGGEEKEFVDLQVARDVLTRLDLSKPMLAVLKVLYAAGEEWVSSADLHKASQYRVPQFAGLMGAFGRRLANTDGYEDGTHFFDFQWDDEVGAWQYRLPENVRIALEAEKLI